MEQQRKKVRITIEIDVGQLVDGVLFFAILVCRIFYFPVVLLLYFFIGDRAFTQRQRWEAYTAKKHFTPQSETLKGEEINPTLDAQDTQEYYTTSWDIYSQEQTKCLHPSCENSFKSVMRGNQMKRFCSQKCKDDFHNKKKSTKQ